jgi:hypothetical protein
MVRKLSIICIAAILLTSIACRHEGRIATLPPRSAPVPAQEITAALPVIPEAKFNLADYGAIGDGK